MGKAKNDSTYHLYDITQKLRDKAHRINDVERLSKSIGLETVSPADTIPTSKEKSNSIPPIYKDAIQKKEGIAKFLADLKEIHEEYAQSVVSNPSGNSILETSLSALEEIAHKDKNLFHRIIEAVKRFISHIKGNKTTRKLEADLQKLERKLQDVYESAETKIPTEDIGEKSSIGLAKGGKPVAIINEDILKGVPKSKWVEVVKDVMRNRFKNGIPIKGRLIKINKQSRDEYTNSKYSKYLKTSDGTVYIDKLNAAGSIDDIILATTNYINEALNHARNDDIKEFARGDVLIRIGKNDYSAKVIVGFTTGQNMVLYDIVDFTKTNIQIVSEDTATVATEGSNSRNAISSNDSIRQTREKSQENFESGEKFSLRGDRLEELRYNPTMFAKRLIKKFNIKNVEVEELAGKLRELVVKHNKGGKDFEIMKMPTKIIDK